MLPAVESPQKGPMQSPPQGYMQQSPPQGYMQQSLPQGYMQSPPQGPMQSEPQGYMQSPPQGYMSSPPQGYMQSPPQGPMQSEPFPPGAFTGLSLPGPMLSGPPPLPGPSQPGSAKPPGPTKYTGPVSSLPLEKFLYFDNYYSYLFFVIEYLLFVYKGFRFHYPPAILAIEVVSLTFFMIYQFTRLHFGSYGNKLEASGTMGWFLVLNVPAIICFVFYLRLQTYTLLIDTIIGATALFFILMELILGLLAMLKFNTYERLV